MCQLEYYIQQQHRNLQLSILMINRKVILNTLHTLPLWKPSQCIYPTYRDLHSHGTLRQGRERHPHGFTLIQALLVIKDDIITVGKRDLQ